ncbi:ATP-grasp domain-containing protein [Francisella orientalis]|uniref:ATP-grasp domain-containing protein n=2 Tax=Francisella orientalis TaxID=299583 RepID=A0AAP7FTC7_9GAMM|nr:ATP-grasp domain-containing protein [Francisella orientalis]AFJ43876.1 phosphoribosylglycinamide synthetase [Francisella orientalis str. Toba 04]AHB99185.1 hypothetical protein M973_05110 [Francisella orientalis LADL 07-285A]AKN85575.1 Phosphoribosylglycinamide synthetase [Francisella orientalis FNO12]AKN87115.1 Phosphoribosylglycinamide synthetase [Francisella orientalis FNO24]AKN88652.1 Phosphoribosylglycinamide synthetase [Francisella orientalis]
MNNKIVVIIDAFSGGKYLAKLLKKNGFNLIHVLSKEGKGTYKAHPDYLEFEDYIDFANENWKSLLNILSNYNIKAIIPGAEEGVYVAEKLASILNLPSNDPKTTILRRDKSLMQLTLKKYGLDTIAEIVFEKHNYLDKLESFNNYPSILKPVDDGGSINVFECHNKEQVIQKARKLFNSNNSMAQSITRLILQEKINSKEFIVNTFTTNREHFITDIWSYRKTYIENGGVIPEMVSLESLDIYYKKFIPYISRILEALNVENGASHIEIFYDEKEFRLVELGARVMGGDFDDDVWNNVTSISQAGAILKVLEKNTLTQDMFYTKAKCSLVLFPSYVNGIIEQVLDLEDIKTRCQSLYKYQIFVKKGDTLNVAKDDTGPYLAFFILINEDQNIFQRDLDYIESLRNTLVRVDK